MPAWAGGVVDQSSGVASADSAYSKEAVDALADVDRDVVEDVFDEPVQLALRHPFVEHPRERHRRGERERHRADEPPGQSALRNGLHGVLLSAMAASSAALSAALPFRTAMPKFSRVCSGDAAIFPPDSSATSRTVQLS